MKISSDVISYSSPKWANIGANWRFVRLWLNGREMENGWTIGSRYGCLINRSVNKWMAERKKTIYRIRPPSPCYLPSQWTYWNILKNKEPGIWNLSTTCIGRIRHNFMLRSCIKSGQRSNIAAFSNIDFCPQDDSRNCIGPKLAENSLKSAKARS